MERQVVRQLVRLDQPAAPDALLLFRGQRRHLLDGVQGLLPPLQQGLHVPHARRPVDALRRQVALDGRNRRWMHQLHLVAQQQPVAALHHAAKDQADHQADAARRAQVVGPWPPLLQRDRLLPPQGQRAQRGGRREAAQANRQGRRRRRRGRPGRLCLPKGASLLEAGARRVHLRGGVRHALRAAALPLRTGSRVPLQDIHTQRRPRR
mmetsp:Transcript_60824/g.166689  ORF Transcript_60824/g.166689 Transcript_60824/m.166689 type:complete len:208 (+) Transcript_60824:794-1417(+)